MKFFVHMLVLLSLCPAGVQAATCRSGSAAIQGSQTGYKKDKQAAEQIAQTERSSSDILGKCVAGITLVITAPQFPSLSEIFNQIKNKVCQIASNQINGAVNEVNSQINGAISGINKEISTQVNNTGVNQVIDFNPQIKGPNLQQTSDPKFWSNIWK